MKHFCINSLIISILVLSTSCAPGPSAPTTALLGQWAFASSDGGSEDFASSLVFDEAGTLTIEENWFNQGATLSYVVIAPGRLKITYQDQPQLVNYDLQEDTLTLIFKSGSNTYSRISRPATPPPADSQITTAEPPNTPFPPTATHTLTWAPTFTIQPPTPTPTNTKSEPTKTPSKYLTPTPKAYYPLPNCAASQLHVGDSAYISYEGKKNRLRSSPDTHPSDNIIGEILQGEVVEIIDGPKCNYGWVLWKVRTTRNEVGWTPEGNTEEFYMFPLTTRQLCPNTLPSRLIVDQMAFVQEEPDLPNRVRTEPNTSAEVLGYINPKEKMFIIRGPECFNNANWWYVESEKSGLRGWTMENTSREYYLAPIP